MSDLDRLVDTTDVDGLLRVVEQGCDRLDWDHLVALRLRCLAAAERGRQLWPVAAHIAHRLALAAPAEVAVTVLDADGRFLPGPLTEVVAGSHTWDELDPVLRTEPLRTLVAHERVVRGEDLTAVGGIDPRVLDLPRRLQPWEAVPPPPEYGPYGVTVSEAQPARGPWVDLPAPAAVVDDDLAVDALAGLVRPWTEQSNGRATAVAVRGVASSAVSALGPRRVVWEPLTLPEAVEYLICTAASGGAHGRRRGLARGRFEAWWTIASLGGAVDDWPLTGEEVREIGEELSFARWDPGDPPGGWRCHLAVEDPADGLAWALSATDAR